MLGQSPPEGPLVMANGKETSNSCNKGNYDENQEIDIMTQTGTKVTKLKGGSTPYSPWILASNRKFDSLPRGPKDFVSPQPHTDHTYEVSLKGMDQKHQIDKESWRVRVQEEMELVRQYQKLGKQFIFRAQVNTIPSYKMRRHKGRNQPLVNFVRGESTILPVSKSMTCIVSKESVGYVDSLMEEE
ncbi:hypothetical protein VNO78_17524 [Psophocarpus tetragonolobus]|uniref:Uncharacterized protein n=1 Tax=Psophocarpus tetragonolobus TaxID=3891 RepID=A0AAN9SGY2_PSOTE